MDYNFLHLLQASVMELQDLHRKGALTIANGYGDNITLDGLTKLRKQLVKFKNIKKITLSSFRTLLFENQLKKSSP
jgi:hypothetical protein